MGDDDISMGELNRSLQKLDATVKRLDDTVSENFKGYVTTAVYESERNAQDHRIESLEERFKNAARLGVGAVIAVVVPVVLGLLKVYGGS